MVVLQIETRKALEAREELLAVPGIDAVMIGPADLSISLGVPGEFQHPAWSKPWKPSRIVAIAAASRPARKRARRPWRASGKSGACAFSAAAVRLACFTNAPPSW